MTPLAGKHKGTQGFLAASGPTFPGRSHLKSGSREVSLLFHAGVQPPLLPSCFLAGCAPGKSSSIQAGSRGVFGNAAHRALPKILLTPGLNPVKHRLHGTLQPCPHQLDLWLWRIFSCFCLTGAELTLPNLCLQGFSSLTGSSPQLQSLPLRGFSARFSCSASPQPASRLFCNFSCSHLRLCCVNNSTGSAESARCSSLFQIT